MQVLIQPRGHCGTNEFQAFTEHQVQATLHITDYTTGIVEPAQWMLFVDNNTRSVYFS